MTTLKTAWRIARTLLGTISFFAWTTIATLVLTPILALWPSSLATKRRWTRRTISKMAWLYLRQLRLLRLIDFRLGPLTGLDQPGRLIIANHPTLLDAIFLMSVLPQASFVVKAVMARNPLTAGMVSLAGYLPNSYNGPHLIAQAVETLKQGQSLVIFPEGTRTATEQLIFQRGAANIALRAGCVIQPVLINCQPRVLRKHEKWYQVPQRTPMFTLESLDPIEVHSHADSDQPINLQARELTRELQNKFSAKLQSHPDQA